MIGDLLGDGHLRFCAKKGADGLPKPNTNVQFSMTRSLARLLFCLLKTEEDHALGGGPATLNAWRL
jgi:hypothetical protein